MELIKSWEGKHTKFSSLYLTQEVNDFRDIIQKEMHLVMPRNWKINRDMKDSSWHEIIMIGLCQGKNNKKLKCYKDVKYIFQLQKLLDYNFLTVFLIIISKHSTSPG